ncbi:stage III sporulation protein AG [Paenibacillus albus]|uniref:Stage III sporulation protein AG n=1 Tax=Paenibacillus albus TaxID=2495582 RepID=A0A3S9ADD3_9BACL|nr:stage III sporulation protein AG [Paenibacillus albus]
MAKWLDALESTVGGGRGGGGPKRVKTLRWLLILGGIGIALVILNSFLDYRQVPASDQQTTSSSTPPSDPAFNNSSHSDSPFGDIEHSLENRLKEILEKVVGVGTVDVLITVDSTEESVVQLNEKESQQITNESDKSGGKRTVTSITKEGQVVLYDTSGDKAPIIVKRLQPKIRGILIVAKGAENGTVRRLIVDAVEKGLNVAVNRISVIPRKHQ